MKRVVLNPGTKLVRLGQRPPKVIGWLLGIIVGLFIIYAFLKDPIIVHEYFCLNAKRILTGFAVWQPITAVFLHTGTRGLIFDGVALWLFGTTLLRWWGRSRFILFWITTSVWSMIAVVPFAFANQSQPISGSLGGSMAMLLAVGILFSRHQLFMFGLIPIQMRWFSSLFISAVLIGSALERAWLEMVIAISGLIAALPFLYPPRRLLAELRLRQAKKKFNIIDGGKSSKDRYVN